MTRAPPLLWKCPLLSCDSEFKSARLRLAHLEETHWKTATDEESDAPRRLAQRLSLFDGDFIAVIGSEDKGLMEITVSPEVLSIVSPVWKVLFLGSNGGQFAESSQRRATFPNDDPDTMLLLFAIAHMEYDYILKTLDFDQLYHLAVVCNIYDCAKRVSVWARDWINPHREEQLKVEQGDPRYMMIAWVFGDVEGFDIIAKRLLKYGTHAKKADTLVMSGKEIADDPATDGLIASVLRTRERLLDDLFKICDDIISDSSIRKRCSVCSDVVCTVLRLGNFIHALKSMSLWPERPPLHEMLSLNDLWKDFQGIWWDSLANPTYSGSGIGIFQSKGLDRMCVGNMTDNRLKVSLQPIFTDLPTITISPDHQKLLESTAAKLSLFIKD